jgi:hypothetical protein
MVGIRRTDGSAPKLLGPGYGLDQAPDGSSVIIAPIGQSEVFHVVPTGAGVARELRHPGWALLEASYTADGRHALVWGRQPKGELRLLRFPVAGGPAEVLPGKAPLFAFIPSADGRTCLTLDAQRRPVLKPLDGGAERLLAPPLREGENLLGWDLKDRALVGLLNQPAAVAVDQLDLRTGQRSPWQRVGPADPSGVMTINDFKASRDFKTVVYTYRRVITSDLFLVDGLR